MTIPTEYTHYRRPEDKRPGIQLLQSKSAIDQAVGAQLLKNLVTTQAPWHIVCDDFPAAPGEEPTKTLDDFIASGDCPLYAMPYLMAVSAKWKTQFTAMKSEDAA